LHQNEKNERRRREGNLGDGRAVLLTALFQLFTGLLSHRPQFITALLLGIS